MVNAILYRLRTGCQWNMLRTDLPPHQTVYHYCWTWRRAVAWGWPESRMLMIDDDLGRSGTSAERRHGLQRQVAEGGLEHVGLIYAEAYTCGRRQAEEPQLCCQA